LNRNGEPSRFKPVEQKWNPMHTSHIGKGQNIFWESLSSGCALKNALQPRGVRMNQPSVTHHALYFLFYKKLFLRLKKGESEATCINPA
jgi:hypothetical protein